MMTQRRYALACLFAVLLAGCSQAPVIPPPGYLLPGATAIGAHSVTVEVRLAGYLDQGGIVYQLSNSELHLARQHRWAEPLDSQLERSLHAALASHDLPDSGQLVVSLSQFQGVQSDGGDQAVIRGVWLFSKAGEAPRQGTISWQAPVPADGYPTLVETLDRGWQDTARVIVSGLEQ
ncbi:PqiC family protein [Marinobacter mobilis]|uniref:ABC-type transport auxiliary lipoprotein component domain-containing protein n=1 Tax=Marinobacter mobilis TaxID=488533 RepID=A0A1H2S7E8_9GAMM|nr:ABC-type transport auxiliary lipoprotein family protein [Marinobacter mobilis]SDW27561.1 hypothetical protein SAMN04487960_10247 [Marinobacter mobilis]